MALSTLLARAETFRHDAAYAFRGLRRAPGLATAIIVTLALGVGVNASVFSLLDRVYFQAPAGVENPGAVRRVYVSTVPPAGPYAGTAYYNPFVSIPDLRDLQTTARGAAWIEGYMGSGVEPLGSTGDSASVAFVTGEFLPMLGVHPARGRFFDSTERRFGDPRPVAVLSHRFWRRHFGSDPAVVGRTVPVRTTTYTIIGVAQSGFDGVDLDGVDVWIPLAALGGGGEVGSNWYDQLGTGVVTLLARLDGRTDRRSLDARLTAQYRRTNAGQAWVGPGSSVVTAPLIEALGPLGLGPRDERNLSLAIRLAVAGLAVMVLAAANVASLLLMRALRRRREIAVRLALGISRWRLAAQTLTESVLLAILACGAALLLASWIGSALRATLLSDIRWSAPVVDLRVVAVAAVLTFVAAIAAGLAPAALVRRDDIALALKAGAPEAGGPGSALRVALLVTQAALCMALLSGAGAFGQSLRRATTLDRGFDAGRLITVGVSGRPTTDAEVDEAAAQIRTMPGARSATALFDLRPEPRAAVWTAAGDTLGGARSPTWNVVDPNYFRVAGMRLLAGRTFGGADGPSAEPVAVVTQALAKALWPRGALGGCFYTSWPRACRRVVGVIGDIRWDVTVPSQPGFFVPRTQGPPRATPSSIIVRTAGATRPQDAAAILGMMRQTLGRAGSLRVQRVTDRLEPQVRPVRVSAALFSLFGTLALLSAAVGVFGLVSYEVTGRARELAVRIALGASSDRLVRHVVGGGLRIAALGLLAGTVAALLAGKLVASFLFETSPYDPVALAAAALTIALAIVLASMAAARRATRLEPVVVLNSE